MKTLTMVLALVGASSLTAAPQWIQGDGIPGQPVERLLARVQGLASTGVAGRALLTVQLRRLAREGRWQDLTTVARAWQAVEARTRPRTNSWPKVSRRSVTARGPAGPRRRPPTCR